MIRRTSSDVTEAMIRREGLRYGGGMLTYSWATVCRHTDPFHAWMPCRTRMAALDGIQTGILADGQGRRDVT